MDAMTLTLVSVEPTDETEKIYIFNDVDREIELSLVTRDWDVSYESVGETFELNGGMYKVDVEDLDNKVVIITLDDLVTPRSEQIKKLDAMTDEEIADMSDLLFHADVLKDGVYGYPVDIFADMENIAVTKKLDPRMGEAARVVIHGKNVNEYSLSWYATVIRGWLKDNLDRWENIEPSEIGKYEYENYFGKGSL